MLCEFQELDGSMTGMKRLMYREKSKGEKVAALVGSGAVGPGVRG